MTNNANTADAPNNEGAPVPSPARLWAIVEIFGHGRIAGAVSEHPFGGETFTRVDVPEVLIDESRQVDGQWQSITRVIPPHTKLLGGKAVYSIAFVDEAAALAAAHAIRHQPISSYTLRDALRQLSPGERRELLLSSDTAAIDG